jgi:hypothetical protein
MLHKTSRFTLTIMAIFVLCGSATSSLLSDPHPGLTEEDMRLSQFGSTSFLALMALKKQISDDFDPDNHTANFYNELFYEVITKDRKKELELLLVYMKTFQRDLRSKCKMAMLTKLSLLQNLGSEEEFSQAKAPFFARCNTFAEEVFRRLHMNVLFFNLNFIVQSFRVLLKNGSVLFYVVGETDNELIKTRNEAFMATLEVMAAEAEKPDKERGWVAKRFNMIDFFYGPHLPALFGQILNQKTRQVKRLKVELSLKDQRLYDTAFFVDPMNSFWENMRVKSKIRDTTHPEPDFTDLDYTNLFRYYAESAYTPFYDVRKFHMWQQGQAQ